MDNFGFDFSGNDLLSSKNESNDDILSKLGNSGSNILSDMVSGSKEEDNRGNRNSNWVSYYKKLDIEPYDPKLIQIKRSGKSFLWYIYNKDPLLDDDVLKIKKVGKFLGNKGYVMRYNGDNINGYTNMLVKLDETVSEAYLPWNGFNKELKKPITKWGTEMGYRIAMEVKKNYTSLKDPIRALYASLVDCMIGKSGKDIVDICVVWTKCGSSTFKDIRDYNGVGNLTFIISMCNRLKIPLFNIKSDSGVEKLVEYVTTH